MDASRGAPPVPAEPLAAQEGTCTTCRVTGSDAHKAQCSLERRTHAIGDRRRTSRCLVCELHVLRLKGGDDHQVLVLRPLQQLVVPVQSGRKQSPSPHKAPGARLHQNDVQQQQGSRHQRGSAGHSQASLTPHSHRPCGCSKLSCESVPGGSLGFRVHSLAPVGDGGLQVQPRQHVHVPQQHQLRARRQQRHVPQRVHLRALWFKP